MLYLTQYSRSKKVLLAFNSCVTFVNSNTGTPRAEMQWPMQMATPSMAHHTRYTKSRTRSVLHCRQYSLCCSCKLPYLFDSRAVTVLGRGCTYVTKIGRNLDSPTRDTRTTFTVYRTFTSHHQLPSHPCFLCCCHTPSAAHPQVHEESSIYSTTWRMRQTILLGSQPMHWQLSEPLLMTMSTSSALMALRRHCPNSSTCCGYAAHDP